MKNFLFALLLVLSSASFAQDERIAVLTYHQLGAEKDASQTVISLKAFESHLDRIAKLGYSTITLSKLAEHLATGHPIPEKSVVLTFDDGWKTDLLIAEALRKRNMTGTFYFMSGASKDPTYLTFEEMRSIARTFEVGAHTHTHFMQWEGKMDQADERIIYGEIMMSKLILEDQLGVQVKTFSWPFGYFRPQIVKHLHRMGFSSAVIINSISAHTRGHNPMMIDRINIDGRCTADDIEGLLKNGNLRECK